MSASSKDYLVGGEIGSLAAAAFLIRDGKMPGERITIHEADPVLGGGLDAAGDPSRGYSMLGGRMFTTDNDECTWARFKTIPSLVHEGQAVFDETISFSEVHQSDSKSRLVDRQRAKVPVQSIGVSMQDRIELCKLTQADEDSLAASRITDWLSPSFFETKFWFMWSITFAFLPWPGAVEFRRYLHRFLLEFSRIQTLAGVKRASFNHYDSLVQPFRDWLEARSVRVVEDCRVTEFEHRANDGQFIEVRTTSDLSASSSRFPTTSSSRWNTRSGLPGLLFPS